MIFFRYETYNHYQRFLNEDLFHLKNDVEIIKRGYKGPFVLVTGDSWSAGEWDIDKGLHWISQHSIAKYLEKNHAIATCWGSNPGWNDELSLGLVKKLHHLFDYVVFVKSCSSRIVKELETDKELETIKISDIFQQWTNYSNYVYKKLSPIQEKLILIGGLNKINEEGLKLNTLLTIPSIMEEYDSEFKASEWFGDEDIWEMYKKHSKYQESLLKAMDNFYEQKSYLLSKPELYYPDGFHPNRKIHKDLAEKIAKVIGKK
ncbi:uncharacterized protein METZ01_LOCUS134008 [marine metagenome]|uniref:SGNH hydrolase-type esterase domain-containing protein n=1 Tax=marine metagenome TaxID=408172 RepID=A0A381YW25_9ZZZZ